MAQLFRIAQPVRGQLFGKFNAVATVGWQHNHMETQKCNYDLAIVGGGIVGIAAAREMQLRHSNLRIAVIEKEQKLAAHQSCHNSGIIHEGLYNQPDSLSAKLCVKGSNLTYMYCNEKNIPYRQCGKLIVAANESEVPKLVNIYALGVRNKVPDLQFIDGTQITRIEPFCRGVKALWSPHTSVVNWALVTEYLAKDFLTAGGDIYLNSKVTKFSETDIVNSNFPVTIHGVEPNQILRARYVLTCGGLYADQLAELTSCRHAPCIVPLRGEYLCLKSDATDKIRGIISSVQFLDLNCVPQIDGNIWFGPTVVLAFDREGYTSRNINKAELLDTLRYSGFRKMAAKYYKRGLKELIKTAFIPQHIKAIQRYLPSIKKCDVMPGPVGVYALAVDMDGNVLNEFVFTHGMRVDALSDRVLHCLNPPTPGATCSLAFAKVIADKLEEDFKFSKGVRSEYWAKN